MKRKKDQVNKQSSGKSPKCTNPKQGTFKEILGKNTLQTKKASRIAYTVDKAGKKVRIAKRSGTEI